MLGSEGKIPDYSLVRRRDKYNEKTRIVAVGRLHIENLRKSTKMGISAYNGNTFQRQTMLALVLSRK